MKFFDDHEEFISLYETDKIINNLDIKKSPIIEQINNKLIIRVKSCLIKIFHFSVTLCINFDIDSSNCKNYYVT